MALSHFNIISLHETPERTKRIKTTFEHLSIPHTIHLFHEQKPGWKGCLDSHRSLIEHAKERSLPFFTIVEDNVDLVRLPNDKMYKKLDLFTRFNKEWDIIYIGACILPYQNAEYFREQIYRTKWVHGTFGYVISSRFYDKILNLPKNKPIDILYSRHANQFIYNPLLFHRKHDLGSIIESRLNGIRAIYFHPVIYNTVEYLFFSGLLRPISILLFCLAIFIAYKGLRKIF